MDSTYRQNDNKLWSEMTPREKFRLANSMTTEEINTINPAKVSDYRVAVVDHLETALDELGLEEVEGRYFTTGNNEIRHEITTNDCLTNIKLLKLTFDTETEESMGFYNYHRCRLWIQAYEFLVDEMQSRFV